MKKSLFVLLMVALALPMMAQYASKAEALNGMNRDKVLTSTQLKAFDGKLDMRGIMNSWTFETMEEIDAWQTIDADGDGYSWGFTTEAAHGGYTSMCSDSYITGVGALTPDNWMIAAAKLNGLLKFWAVNESSYFADMFDVLVSVDGDNWTVVAEDVMPGSSWTQYEVDLSACGGVDGYIAFRHYKSVDMWRVYVDDITIETVVAVPTNVTVDPAATTANVAWENPTNDGWSVRYRPVHEATGYFWDFEDINSDAELPWTSIDADGDGYGWFLWDPITYGYDPGDGERLFGTKCATSASYVSSALTPDNWFVSPKVNLIDKLSFWAGGQDPNYASEVFGVYVSTDDMATWEPLAENVVATSPIQQYIYDLSDYEGMEGYIAIRHYNCTDMFRLNIDNILIGTPAVEEQWILIDGLTAPNCVLEFLEPETAYEVQVMGYNDEGESDWSQSVVFTTLAEDVPPVVYDETCAAPNGEYIIIDKEKALVTITNNEPGATVHYVVTLDGVLVEEGDFTGESWEYIAVGPGAWLVSCVASMPGKNDSNPGGVFFPIAPGQTPVAVDEMMAGKTISSVRYFNAAGQEMQEANGMTIVVTTYSDGTTNAVKVVK